MKKILFLIITSFWLGQTASAASYESLRRQCQELMQQNLPQIKVEYVFGKLNIDNTKSAEELITLSKSINPLVAQTHKIQGLTQLMFSTTMNIETFAQSVDENNICVMPKTVSLHLYFDNPTIYMVNTLKPNTCRWNLVMRHEQTHVDIGHAYFKQMAFELKEKLQSIVNMKSPKIYSYREYNKNNQNMAQKTLQEYEKALRPTVNILQKKLLKQQSLLDTAENYQKETKLCPPEE